MDRIRRGSWLLVTAVGLGAGLAAVNCGPPAEPRAPEPAAGVAASASPSASAARPAGLSAADLDQALGELWKQEGVTPAPLVDDARFLRRLSIDLRGVIPAPEEVEQFLADRAPDRRARAIDRMLEGDRFNDHWTNYWDRVLLGRSLRQALVDRDSFRAWVRQKIAARTPWDRTVYELLTATGNNRPDPLTGEVNGAVNWLLKYRDAPADLSGSASRVFLGVQIQCAQCHDHKTEKWKQDDFRRLTACFMQTRFEQVDQEGKQRVVEVKDLERVARGNARQQGGRGEYLAVAPGALDGADFSASPNRRQALGQWFTAPENPWFARAFVNRMWGHLFGRGFVDPVDDFRESNPAAAPALLDRLAADFVAQGYDVRGLLRTLTSTEAYQRAAGPRHADRPAEARLWARYRLQPLGSDELLDSLVAATRIDALLGKGNQEALDRVRVQMRSQFSLLFDVDEEEDTDDSYDGTIPQALLMLNGRLTSAGIGAVPGSALADILAAPGDDASRIRALYLRTLSREPGPDETRRWLAFLAEPRPVVRTSAPSSAISGGDGGMSEADGMAAGKPGVAAGGMGAGAGKAAAGADGAAGKAGAKAGEAAGAGKAGKVGKKAARGGDPLAALDRPRRQGNEAGDARRQAFEDMFWALLNSSEFFFNH